MFGWLAAMGSFLRQTIERLAEGRGLAALGMISGELPLTGDPETDARIIELYYRHMTDYE